MPPCRRMPLILWNIHAKWVLCFVSSHATNYATRHLYHKSLCDVTDELAKRHGFVTVLRQCLGVEAPSCRAVGRQSVIPSGSQRAAAVRSVLVAANRFLQKGVSSSCNSAFRPSFLPSSLPCYRFRIIFLSVYSCSSFHFVHAILLSVSYLFRSFFRCFIPFSPFSPFIGFLFICVCYCFISFLIYVVYFCFIIIVIFFSFVLLLYCVLLYSFSCFFCSYFFICYYSLSNIYFFNSLLFL
jgi:hypothetical protein